MKIVIINGSHRKDGNCYQFAQMAYEILKEKNEVSAFNLLDCFIGNCNGCLICEDGESCPIVDDYSSKIRPELIACDLIVFASPTYFNMPSSLLVNLFDRTNDLCEYFSENKKRSLVYMVGQTDQSSVMDAYNCIKSYLDIMNMEEIMEPIIRIARMPEPVDESVLDLIKTI